MEGTNFTVFSRTWDSSLNGKLVPMNVDKKVCNASWLVRLLYAAIYDHLKEWPAFDLDTTKIAVKLRKDT
ncbi:hypothetical protein RCOM_0482750 [Ricinus communis]|uniref:Uncharacterized protein n=1 Tax=Ricinus communis TaxID=3988 RepID=B9SMY6_RICCO|nr:hypothetical protein RCOM_0482750 [Ricinus communis]